MTRLRAASHLQQLTRPTVSPTAPNKKSPSLSVSHAPHAKAAPPLYPRQSMAHRVASRFAGSGEMFARVRNLNSRSTWDATFFAHTRVGTNHSPLNDLPLGFPKAKKGKELPLKKREQQAPAANHFQASMSAARTNAAVGLFGAQAPAAGESFDNAAAARVDGSMREAVILIARLFPTASDAQFCRLQQSLHALRLPAQTDRTTIAYALASAADGDIGLAQQVLAYAAQGMQLTEIPTSTMATRIGRDADICARAHKFAGLLSQTEAGFATLKTLHPSHAAFDRAAKVLLQTGMHATHCEPLSLAARSHAAAVRMLDPGVELTASEKAAIFVWEQGFRSDADGSSLQAMKRQLARFTGKTIPQAGASRFATFLPRLCGKKKSPLTALRQGLHGANRPSLAKERDKVQCALHATVSDLLANVLQDPAAILRESDPADALAALASLRYWTGRPASYPGQRIAIDNCLALARDMACIINTIPSADRQRYPEQFAALTNAAKSFQDDPDMAFYHRPAMRRLMRQPLTLKRLAAWGKLRKIAADEPFWQHLGELKKSLQPPDFQVLKRRHLSTRHSLDTLIEGMESSSRLRLTDGRRCGFSTRGLSTNLSRLLHLSGIPLGPRLTLGREKRHRAVVEVARSSYGGEILIGTERCRRTTIGAGLMVGYDLKLGPPQARIAVSVDVDRSRKQSKFSGVALRVAQRKKEDGTPDHERRTQGMRKIMNFMFEEQSKPGGKMIDQTKVQDSAEQMFERFATAFFDDPDISLSWNGARGKSTTYAASAVAAGLIKIDGTPLNAGPGVGVTAERTRAKASSYGNHTGRTQSAFNQKSNTTDIDLTIGIKGKISHETPGQPSTAVAVSLLNASLPAWTIPVYTRGTTGKAQLIRENGALVPAYCVLDLEFTQASDYAEILKTDRYRWVEQLAKKHVGNPDALGLASRQLDMFLDTARHHARRNQRFVQRMQLRPDIASQIDRHCSTAALIRDNQQLSIQERDRLCAAREAACVELVARPGAWIPQELKILEKSAGSSQLGLLIGLQMATETSAEGEHQLASLRV